MVTPLSIIFSGLLVAFLLGLLNRISGTLTRIITLLTLAFTAAVSLSWLIGLLGGAIPESATLITTAGFDPPVSIALRMGVLESGLTLLVTGAFFLGAIYLQPLFRRRAATAQVLYLLMMVGASGVIMTRDLFNLFVFLEILSIATYGLLALDDQRRSLAAGFKYVIAGGIASAMFLMGTIYLYRLTGTLNIDDMIAKGFPEALAAGAAAAPAVAAIFLVTAALLIELKPFPANGWALDVYEASHPGITSLLSIGASAAILSSIYKLLPLMPPELLTTLGAVGFITFALSNYMGLKQTDGRRMLGYSSVAQIGLILAVITTGAARGVAPGVMLLIAGGFLLNHYLAKGGLFWLFGALGIRSESQMRSAFASSAEGAGGTGRAGASSRGAFGFVLLITLFLALAGLPPFPGFWAKWELISLLTRSGSYISLALLLGGSLFEIGYLFRWVRYATEGSTLATHASEAGVAEATDRPSADDERPGLLVPALSGLLAIAAGPLTGWLSGFRELWLFAPVALFVGLGILDVLPNRLKGVIALTAVGWGGYSLYPAAAAAGALELFFLALLGGGSLLLLIAPLRQGGRQPLYYASAGALALAMLSLLVAQSSLALFVAWEFMTVAGYLLLLRRREAASQAYRYFLFSMGGAFALLLGLALLGSAGVELAPAQLLAAISTTGGAEGTTAVGSGTTAALLWPSGALGVSAAILVGLAVLIKLGALGVHIWLPGSYAEAEDETTALFSGVFSKAPLFLLLAVIGAISVAAAPAAGGAFGGSTGAASGTAGPGGVILQIIGWVGVATALFGALLALFQEDVKYLLAYSSMSQLGYIVLALSMATHLGWVTGLYIAAIHFVFKGMLFLAIAGVIQRTGKRQMYELGGLIKKMPITYISVLMAIIALSGVPPLAGFGGKWLLYTALMETGWYMQAGVAFFASTVAFLYLFKLIYTVFLGQLKDDLREVREASPILLIPQVVLIGVLMTFSMFPNTLLQPLIAAVDPILSSTVSWSGYTVISSLGYWNGNAVMWVTMAVFILPLLWLMTVMRRPQRVGQFDMVYAGERPERPETTHFAHNFFAPYQRALGGLVRPAVLRFWAGIGEGISASAGALRRIYTGNGQTYAVHILLFVAVLYLIIVGTV